MPHDTRDRRWRRTTAGLATIAGSPPRQPFPPPPPPGGPTTPRGRVDDEGTGAAWESIPGWTMIATEDLAVPAASPRFMAERAGSHTVEIDASHAVTVSEPQAVARLIDRAATATR